MRLFAAFFYIFINLFLNNLYGQRIEIKDVIFNGSDIYQIKFSPDNSLIITNYRKYIHISNAENLEINQEIPISSHSIEVAYQNPVLAYGDEEGNLYIHGLNDLKNVLTVNAHSSKIICIRFSHNDKFIATTGLDNLIKIWSVDGGDLISELHGHEDYVTDFQFSKDDKVLISCSADKSVKIWEYTQPKIIKNFLNNSRWLRKIAISPDGNTFATASDDRKIIIYSLENFSFYTLKKVHVNLISDIKFFNENYLISIGHDQKISLSSIHFPQEEEILDFFNGNPSYRHYFRGIGRDKYFTSLEINHTNRKIYISTLGRGVISTDFFHNQISKSHEIYINRVDDYVIDSSFVRSKIEVRNNPFKIFGSVTRPENIYKSYVEYVADEKKTSLAVTNKNGKFTFQGVLNENSHEYKIIIIDKDPHLAPSEYYFKAYRHKNASFPESLIPPLPK